MIDWKPLMTQFEAEADTSTLRRKSSYYFGKSWELGIALSGRLRQRSWEDLNSD